MMKTSPGRPLSLPDAADAYERVLAGCRELLDLAQKARCDVPRFHVALNDLAELIETLPANRRFGRDDGAAALDLRRDALRARLIDHLFASMSHALQVQQFVAFMIELTGHLREEALVIRGYGPPPRPHPEWQP